MKAKTALMIILSAAALLNACSSENEVKILTVSSTKEVVVNLARAYKKEYPKSHVSVLVKSTGNIFTDINTGQSDSNIIVLVNSELLTQLTSSSKIRTVLPFGKNYLMLVGSRYAKLKLDDISDLNNLAISNEKLGSADPSNNVTGQLSVDVLKYYNVYDNIKERLKFFSNANNTLQATENGVVNYAIIMQTEALSSDDVKVILAFPQESYSPILYSIGTVDYNYSYGSEKFMEFIQTQDAQDILDRFGFL